MDDNKNKPEPTLGENGDNKPQESTGSDNSYYYSYGPFQSYSRDREESRDELSYERQQPEEVEVVRPQPIKPISSAYDIRPSSSEGTRASSGGAGTPPGKGTGNWQYNQKQPKKVSFKSVVAGGLAGMLILLGGMVYADTQNLFTGNEAAVAPAVSSSVSGSQSNSSGSSASNVLFPMTNPGDVTSVVQQASAAVVKIETLVKQSKQSSSQSPYSTDPFYQYFFGGGSSGGGSTDNNNGGTSSGTDQLVPTGIGSGFIFEKEGYILTNEHVVHDADVVQVTLQDSEKPYEAKVLGTSYELDLAVLKIEGNNDFPSIPLGDSDSTEVGEWLVAIGNPQGFDHTVTAGVLSAKERGGITIAGENGEKDREYEHLLQTDASINPGNSGGPLLNLSGEVVGINVAVSSDAQGIGFAIPTSTINEVLDKLKNNEKIPQKPVPFIGASLMTMTSEVAKQMGTDVEEGSVISEIVYKSPAYNADLRPYDIITGADGKKHATKEDLIEYIQKQEVGTEVTFNVVRDGKTIDLKVTIGDKNDFSNLE